MLKLCKGGKLTQTEWIYDEEKEEGSYVTEDVTDQAIRLMWEYCDLEEDIILKDVLLLLNTELDIFDAIIGNWCKETVTEGLKPSNNSTTSDIEYLELYWILRVDDKWVRDKKLDTKVLHGLGFPEFHGWGLWDDPNFEPGYKGGISLSFIPVNELINLPLKVHNELSIEMWNTDDIKDYQVMKYPKPQLTLGHILYGIMWELSWHGSPLDSQKRKEKVFKTLESIKLNGDKICEDQ